MEVEVLASGRCLLGHPVSDRPADDEPAVERAEDSSSPPSFPAPRDLKPRRRARTMPETEPPADLPRSIRTAPTPERTLRSVPPPSEDVPSPDSVAGDGSGEGSGDVPASAPEEPDAAVVPRISRPWAPVEPDGPSGPVGDQEPWLRRPEPSMPPISSEPRAPERTRPASRPFEPPRPRSEPTSPRPTLERVAPPAEPEPAATRPGEVQAALRDVLAERDRAEAVPEPHTAPRLPKDLTRPSEDKPKSRRLRLPFTGRTRVPAAQKPPGQKPVAESTRTLASVPPPADPAAKGTTSDAKTKKRSGAASLDAMLAGREPAPREPAAKPEPKIEPKPEPKSESKAGHTRARQPKAEPDPAATAEPPRRIRETPTKAPPIPAEPAASVAAVPDADRVPGIAPGTRNPPPAPVSRRIMAPTPRNTVAWGLAIAATFIAGVAALVLTPSRADDARPVVRSITLGAVPNHTVQHDPETESRLRAELGAQRAVPRQLSASTIRNADGDIVALYQAIVFNDEVAQTQRDTDDFIALFAEGAGVSADSFAERPLGERMIWSGLLDQGQAILLFRGPEVIIVITAETGAEGDKLADAILGARGI